MQVSAQNSLTWLQTNPAALAAADQLSSADGQVSPSADTSGAGSGQSAISALQSPSQMFGSASLNTLISTQSDASGSDTTSAAAGSSGSTTGAAPAHHHHHHGGGAPPAADTQDSSSTSSTTATGATAATSTAATDSADASAEADLTQVLTNL